MDISNSTEQYMCSDYVAIENKDIDCAHVAHVLTWSGTTTEENVLSTSGSAENSRIIFMLFYVFMADKIQNFVQKVCGTELHIVYLTTTFELNLFN
jgi:hypothetical protein